MPLSEFVLGPTGVAGDAPALITPDGTWSRADLADRTARITPAVASLAPLGGRIAIASDSRPEVVALLLAVPAAGRVAVPLNVRLAPEEMAGQLRSSGTAAVIGTAAELGRLAPALDRVPTLRSTVSLDPGAGDLTLDTLMGVPAPGPAPTPPAPGAPAWIIFTSGTTGRAKGVVLTAASLIAAVACSAAARPLADDEVYLYPFPLYHVSVYNVLHALHRRRPVVLPRRFDTGVIVDLVAQHQVTAMSVAPTMLRLLLDHRARSGDPGSTLAGLRSLAYGAAPMAPSLLREASEALGVGFAQGYGMTELSGNAVFLTPEDHRRGLAGDEHLLGAAGRPGPGVELRIVDDDGREREPGRPGEVEVRTAQACAGYWGDPDGTAALFHDGWLRTGDVGTLDDDGLLTIVDRAKDIIVTGGENVASREVEEALARHPAVARAAVVGAPDDRWGEAVCAVVVLRAGREVPKEVEQALRDHVGASLARFKVPKRVIVADGLPTNPAGKVVKAELRRRLAEGEI